MTMDHSAEAQGHHAGSSPWFPCRLRQRRPLAEPRISGHGNAFGQFVGADWLSVENLPQHRSPFQRLGTCFGRGGMITLVGCHVGQMEGCCFSCRTLPRFLCKPLRRHSGGLTRCFITCARSGPKLADSVDALLGQ